MNARSRNRLIRKRSFTLSAIGFVLLGRLLAPPPCSAQQLTATPFNPNGIYGVGEKVGWTVALPSGVPAPMGNYTYTVKKNNLEAIKSGELDLSSGTATIETVVDEPAMVFVQVMPPAASAADSPTGGRRAAGMALGAAVAPTKLQPSATSTGGFRQFLGRQAQSARGSAAEPRGYRRTNEQGECRIRYRATRQPWIPCGGLSRQTESRWQVPGNCNF